MREFLVGLAAMAIIANLPCIGIMVLIRRIVPRMHGVLRGTIAILAGALTEVGLIVALAEPVNLQSGLLFTIVSLLPGLFIGGCLCLPAVLYLSLRWRRGREADVPAIFE